MLYINENEKTYIRSLYYTKNINEQGSMDSPRSYMTQNQYAGYTNYQNKQTDKTIDFFSEKYKELYNRYSGPDQFHYILSDASTLSAFVQVGVYQNIPKLIHALYHFYEASRNEGINQLKSFLNGAVSIIMSLPNFTLLISKIPGLKNLTNWKVVRNLEKNKLYDFLKNIFDKGLKLLTNSISYVISLIAKVYNFLVSKKMQTLASICKFIIDKGQIIIRFIAERTTYIQKVVYEYTKNKVNSIRSNAIKSTILYATNPINVKGNIQKTKNTQTATQDTTNPRYYKPKTMSKTLNYK